MWAIWGQAKLIVSEAEGDKVRTLNALVASVRQTATGFLVAGSSLPYGIHTLPVLAEYSDSLINLLLTSAFLTLRRTYFPVSGIVSVVYNSHLRDGSNKHQIVAWFSLPALISSGFLTSVFHLWYNYTFIFHFTSLISHTVYLVLGMILLQPKDNAPSYWHTHVSFELTKFCGFPFHKQQFSSIPVWIFHSSSPLNYRLKLLTHKNLVDKITEAWPVL